MGSRSSCEQADPPSHSVPAFDAALTKATIGRADAYINDKFRLEFLDCDCCCDTTKKVANCDFEGNRVLQDLYEMVVTPEYKLNCRCSCGDEHGEKKQTIKFGLTGSPSAQLACDGADSSCPTSSDSRK